jgi:hypothetical protein
MSASNPVFRQSHPEARLANSYVSVSIRTFSPMPAFRPSRQLRPYGGGLITFPSPLTNDRAVTFRHVPKAVYSRGGTRSNLVEACVYGGRQVAKTPGSAEVQPIKRVIRPSSTVVWPSPGANGEPSSQRTAAQAPGRGGIDLSQCGCTELLPTCLCRPAMYNRVHSG